MALLPSQADATPRILLDLPETRRRPSERDRVPYLAALVPSLQDEAEPQPCLDVMATGSPSTSTTSG